VPIVDPAIVDPEIAVIGTKLVQIGQSDPQPCHGHAALQTERRGKGTRVE